MEELFKKDAVYGPIVGRKANGMVDVNYGGTIITLPESENELNFSARLMFAEGGSLYQQRVADNLKHMQTDAAEWKMVPVLEMQTTLNDKGEEVQMPVFDFSVTKGFVKAPTLYPAGTATGALTNCELCNKSIKRVFWIYNPEKKYILQVGSECVTHFGEGKSGKEQVREKQIADALLLDKQLLHLQQVIKQKASKMVTENLGYGRKRSVRQYNQLNLQHWLTEVSLSGAMQKLQDRLKAIDTDFFKQKKASYAYLYTWQQVIELLQPFNYAAELQYAQTPAYKDKQTYTPTIAEAEAAANKKLLAWYSRKGEAQKQAAEKVTALLKAYDYWEPQELAKGGNLPHPATYGSCDIYALHQTKKLLKEGKQDFLIIEGYITLNNGKYLAAHTWLQFTDGTKYDPTLVQFKKKWKDADLKTVKYLKGNGVWRDKNSFMGFSVKYKTKEYLPQDYLKCISKKEAGGTLLLAPNGKPSNLTTEQYRLVRTPQFKAWFGDWENDPANASKVVDENGEPLVVWHGSKSENLINEFVITKRGDGYYKNGTHFKTYFDTGETEFVYFSSVKEIAEKYGKNTYCCFLKMLSPFVIDNKGANYFGAMDLVEKAIEQKIDTGLNDSIIIQNIQDSPSKYGDELFGNTYMATPTQIKLADGTNTSFNAANPDIRFESGGSVNANNALLAPNGKASNLTPEQYRLVRTTQFKTWFGDWEKLATIKFTDPGMDEVTLAHLAKNVSKMVDENGEPLVCFHGTNRDFTVFEERGHAHDRGYYGTGFYFTFQKYGRWMFEAKSEASYYGNKIIPAFLKSISPFDISQLSVYKGHSINYIGTEGLIFLWNVAKKFPGIADSIFVKKKGAYNSEENEYAIEKVPISVLPPLFEKYAKELKTYESYDELHNETKVYGYVKSEIVEYDYTDKGGEKGSYESHDDLVHRGFLKNQHPPEVLEAFFIEAAISKYDGIEADYYPEGYMTRNPQITETIKKEHDAIMQGETGDEVVVFKPTQIKLADGTNTTFNSDNPDIRFEDGGKVTYPKTITVYHGTCASNANQLIKNGWKPNLHESGANQGNSKYLYVSSMAEDALWFAENAGCNTIVKIENVPVSNLLPDPEDESGYTINDLLQRIDKGIMPAKFILHQPLEASYFSVYKKEYADGGITGGKAEGKSLMDIAAAHGVPFTDIYHEWQQGIQVELEHTPNAEIAAQIARDHLVELPDYYTRLKKMEEEAKAEKQIKQFAIPAGFERYYEYVPVDEILPYREFDRSVEHKWNNDDLQRLTESIKKSGIYEPLTLQVSGTKALLVEGNTRLAAAQKLGLLKYIPVSVSNKSTPFKGNQAKKAKPLPRPAVDYDKARYVGIADQNIERSALAHGFSALLPSDIVTCKKCGWQWNIHDSDPSDKYICHQCGTNNQP